MLIYIGSRGLVTYKVTQRNQYRLKVQLLSRLSLKLIKSRTFRPLIIPCGKYRIQEGRDTCSEFTSLLYGSRKASSSQREHSYINAQPTDPPAPSPRPSDPQE